MTLWNADGSRAELSGNGLRCLGQALLLHYDDGRPTTTFHIQTDAGLPGQLGVTDGNQCSIRPILLGGNLKRRPG